MVTVSMWAEDILLLIFIVAPRSKLCATDIVLRGLPLQVRGIGGRSGHSAEPQAVSVPPAFLCNPCRYEDTAPWLGAVKAWI